MKTIVNFIRNRKIPLLIGVAIVCSSYGSSSLGFNPNGQGDMDTWCVYACGEALTKTRMCDLASMYIREYLHYNDYCCVPEGVEQNPFNLPSSCSEGVLLTDIENFFTEITGKDYYSRGYVSWMTDQILSTIEFPCIGIVELGGGYAHCVVICGMSAHSTGSNPYISIHYWDPAFEGSYKSATIYKKNADEEHNYSIYAPFI